MFLSPDPPDMGTLPSLGQANLVCVTSLRALQWPGGCGELGKAWDLRVSWCFASFHLFSLKQAGQEAIHGLSVL